MLQAKISTFLNEKGLTHADFAKAMDVDTSAVTRWIAGSKPRPSALKKINEFIDSQCVNVSLLTNNQASVIALSPTIMLDLTRQLMGELDARELALYLGEADQPHALKELLTKNLTRLRANHGERIANGISDKNRSALNQKEAEKMKEKIHA